MGQEPWIFQVREETRRVEVTSVSCLLDPRGIGVALSGRDQSIYHQRVLSLFLLLGSVREDQGLSQEGCFDITATWKALLYFLIIVIVGGAGGLGLVIGGERRTARLATGAGQLDCSIIYDPKCASTPN